MNDREKVLKDFADYEPYARDLPAVTIKSRVYLDALELLKEHEAKWVESNTQESVDCRLIQCSNCGLTFIVGMNIPYDEWTDRMNYCSQCGARMVKRDADGA